MAGPQKSAAGPADSQSPHYWPSCLHAPADVGVDVTIQFLFQALLMVYSSRPAGIPGQPRLPLAKPWMANDRSNPDGHCCTALGEIYPPGQMRGACGQ